jgi:hypothetical protein
MLFSLTGRRFLNKAFVLVKNQLLRTLVRHFLWPDSKYSMSGVERVF